MKKFLLFIVLLFIGISGVYADVETVYNDPSGLDIGLLDYPIGSDSPISGVEYCQALGHDNIILYTTVIDDPVIEAYQYAGTLFDLYYQASHYTSITCNDVVTGTGSTGSGSFIITTLDEVSTNTRDKVPTAFEGEFGDFVVDLLMLGLIIISIIVWKKVTKKSNG